MSLQQGLSQRPLHRSQQGIASAVAVADAWEEELELEGGGGEGGGGGGSPWGGLLPGRGGPFPPGRPENPLGGPGDPWDRMGAAAGPKNHA